MAVIERERAADQLGFEVGEPELQPVLTECDGCHAEVVLVFDPCVVLERAEIVRPGKCPTCWAKKGLDPNTTCWRCGGTGLVGEELPPISRVWALDEDGRARATTARGRLRKGEAVHREHVCLRRRR